MAGLLAGHPAGGWFVRLCHDGSVDIRTPDRRLRVFVSSTIGELEAERGAARAAIEQLRMTPVMFESGAHPHPAQDVYQAYLQQSDVFVGIYWQRYGWVGPGMTISGLEDEFRRSGRLPRLLYFKRPAPDMEPGLRAMLDAIRSDGGVAYKAFADAAELRELLLNDLATLLSERFGDGGQPGQDAEGAERAAVPAPVTALVGRGRDLDEVTGLLEAQDRRLVVLTGAGGVGKTRLALAVIERSREHWPDGVAFVDLSAVNDASSVPEAIASALGFVGQGREMPLDTLRRRLAGLDMLLTLDNFEHVLEAAPVVAGLLEQAPRLHVLVTSRVVLRVRGEQEWRVDPLSVPPASAAPLALAQAPAVQLFVERVRDVRPGFELTDDSAPAVAELCRRLDGLPLALELAAAWMRLLTPEQMLGRLDERLGRPGGLTDLPDRQQTMTATLEWSYELLPESAQQLLARLSVFAAPFTADGAEAVTGGAGTGGDGLGATESLATLLDHSMISPALRPDGEPVFRMLNVIRRFARQRLEDPDETLTRLNGYLLGILEQAGARHGSQAWALRRLDSEQPNLQVVLRWAADEHRPAGQLLRRIGDVWVWLLVRGLLREGSELRLQIDSWPVTDLRGESDQWAWHWLTLQGLIDDGRFAEAGALIEEILPAARRLEEPSRVGLTLMLRALTRPYIVNSPARAEYEEALTVTRSAGDLIVLGYVLSHLGLFLSVDGDTARARALHEEMLGNARSLGDDNQRAEAHYDLAMDALSEGDPRTAGPHLVRAARHYTDIDNRDGLARCLGALTAMAFEREQSQLAARLIGATEAARTIGLIPWPVTIEAERRVSERVRATLPEAEFTAEEAAGRGQTAETALAEALQALDPSGLPKPG
jgi:predicted ATPase